MQTLQTLRALRAAGALPLHPLHQPPPSNVGGTRPTSPRDGEQCGEARGLRAPGSRPLPCPRCPPPASPPAGPRPTRAGVGSARPRRFLPPARPGFCESSRMEVAEERPKNALGLSSHRGGVAVQCVTPNNAWGGCSQRANPGSGPLLCVNASRFILEASATCKLLFLLPASFICELFLCSCISNKLFFFFFPQGASVF